MSYKNNNLYFAKKFVSIILLLIYSIKKKNNKVKRIGVVGVRHENNIGNNLIKYSISILLKNLGYKPYIIGTHWENRNITFIKQTTNLVIIKKSFRELKRKDYDILMVNSDQTWRKFDSFFYDYGFLKFAENWKIKKFVYGASIGFENWRLSKEDDNIIKKLLKNFSGISVREKGSIELIEKHLGIKPKLVLDPTLLLDKKYYLKIIEGYKGNIIINKKFIFVYNICDNDIILSAVKKAKFFLNYESYYFKLNNNSTIQNFLYYLIKSEAVITNSFHGTIFSIIFKKPFIAIYNKNRTVERFNSLGNLFGLHNRLFTHEQTIDFSQLIKPLKINYTLLNKLKLNSINFIKNNLINNNQ